ncbi:MAG: autotransporter-associated beta strand repeat-containing protein [Verrucomicrobiales bacterium]|nr:autotransporter-associated beta strand repeat-containing protein [Verrucomicrobiales bacterium]
MKPYRLPIFFVGSALFTAEFVSAADQTWDNGGSSLIWSTAATNWDAGAAWTDGNNAIFGSTGAGTINVDGAVLVKDITFNANGYDIGDADTNGTLTLASGNAISVGAGLTATISESLAGTAGLTKSGDGTLILSGTNNAVTGGTVVSGGILKFGNENNNLPAGTVTVQPGGTVDLSALAGNNPTETGNSNRAYVISGTGFNDQGALVNNSGSLIGSAGISGLTLAGDATVSTNVRLDVSGTINLGSYTLTKIGTNLLPFRSVVNSPDATLAVSAGGSYIEQNNLTLNQITLADGTYFGIYAYNGTPGKIVTADIVMNGTSDLRQGSNGTPSSADVYAGTIQINGGNARIRTNGLNSNDSDVRIDSTISGSGVLTLIGGNAARSVDLTAANTFGGDVQIINKGILKLSNANALQNATLDTSTATVDTSLDFTTLTSAQFGGLKGNTGFALENASSDPVALSVGSNDQSTTFSGALTGGGSLTKDGLGVLAISGANSYTGTTTVSAGTLQVGVAGSGSTGSGAVTVESGSTILGSGTVASTAFTLQAGATLQVGDSTAAGDYDTLNFIPSSGAGVYQFDTSGLVLLGLNPASPGDSDLLNFGGASSDTLIFNSSLTLVAPAAFSPTGPAFFDVLDWNGSTTPVFGSQFDDVGLIFGNGDEAAGLDLPDVSGSGYAWSLSDFKTTGTVQLVIAIPEPSRVLLLAVGLALVLGRRRRS